MSSWVAVRQAAREGWLASLGRRLPGPSFALGLVIVVGMALLSFLAPFLGLGDPLAMNVKDRLQAPSLAHLFGTDELGRDVFVRVIYGGKIDLTLGFVTATVSLIIGMAVGTIAGFYRGTRETVIMRTVDVVLSIPFLVLVLAVVTVVGPGLVGVYIGIIAVSWTIYARISYSEMLSLRERQFILAARTLGYGTARIVFRHALPNLFRSNLAWFMSYIVANIVALASLSYLGVGVQPPEPEWGALIAGGQNYLLSAWWISTMPGLVVVLTGIGFVLLGEWLTERVAGDRVARA
jgi:peptide/nickel transport system permease protein